MQRPTKAIIAAAGFGTRFLPQTKAMPKEMMPIIDKPIIQYVVEELVEAGIKDIILVGSSTKRSIEDHFDLPNDWKAPTGLFRVMRPMADSATIME
jgi:UTP--glucose-1-phosphate uridylyltransferase